MGVPDWGVPAWAWPLAAAPFVGSFLGVLVTRLPQERTVVWGRSACPACGHGLGACDLVPVLSWAALGGRCRHCGARIHLLYPAMELGALGVAAWAAALGSGPFLWASCGLGWALLALAVIDARDGLLPDVLTYPLMLAGPPVTALLEPDAVYDRAIGAAAGFGVFWLLALAYRRLRHREGLGLGDAKLLAAAGAWLGWQPLPSVVLVAAVAGLSWVLALRAIGRRLALDTELALGPGLCLGFWLVWLYGPLQ
jgi:leader peptidase (prepilin peptidase)/N-methyltransferase